VSDADSHFFYIVTTDGGKKVSILRTKDQFSDYVLVKGLISATPEDRKFLESFTDDEKVETRFAILLELSRAVMGYKSEKDVLEEITVFRRVPITPSLDESEVFRLMWEVEAMLATIITVQATETHKL